MRGRITVRVTYSSPSAAGMLLWPGLLLCIIPGSPDERTAHRGSSLAWNGPPEPQYHGPDLRGCTRIASPPHPPGSTGRPLTPHLGVNYSEGGEARGKLTANPGMPCEGAVGQPSAPRRSPERFVSETHRCEPGFGEGKPDRLVATQQMTSVSVKRVQGHLVESR
jgi:hypothetical protein